MQNHSSHQHIEFWKDRHTFNSESSVTFTGSSLQIEPPMNSCATEYQSQQLHVRSCPNSNTKPGLNHSTVKNTVKFATVLSAVCVISCGLRNQRKLKYNCCPATSFEAQHIYHLLSHWLAQADAIPSCRLGFNLPVNLRYCGPCWTMLKQFEYRRLRRHYRHCFKARSSATAESVRAHLTSLYRTVQHAFWYVHPFKGARINYRQCWNKLILTKWIYGCRPI